MKLEKQFNWIKTIIFCENCLFMYFACVSPINMYMCEICSCIWSAMMPHMITDCGNCIYKGLLARYIKFYVTYTMYTFICEKYFQSGCVCGFLCDAFYYHGVRRNVLLIVRKIKWRAVCVGSLFVYCSNMIKNLVFIITHKLVWNQNCSGRL